jgi:hypothetical protein
MTFIDVITGISGLTHYYPLDKVHKTNDAWGGTAGAGAGHPAVNFVNQGGVTFAAKGATFTGAENSWLRAPSHRDFSVRHTPTGATGFTVFWAATITNYDQGPKNYYMGKGCSRRGGDTAPRTDGDYEWAIRLYGDPHGEQGRNRGTSAYYWNPNPDVDDGLGSGAFIMPQEGGGTRPPNAPAGFGDNGRETFIGMVFTYPGSSATPGDAKLYGGFNTQQILKINDRDLFADAKIIPEYTVGDLSIGKRLDGDGGMFAFRMRRLAFFNQVLTLSQLRHIGDAMSLAEGTG